MPYVLILLCAVMLAGCQTKGEKKVPCPPLAAYVAADDQCGPASPVNTFDPILKD